MPTQPGQSDFASDQHAFVSGMITAALIKGFGLPSVTSVVDADGNFEPEVLIGWGGAKFKVAIEQLRDDA